MSNVLKVILSSLVGGVGIFGNIFIIVLAVKYTARKNLHHLIINMAVADTLVVLMTWSVHFPFFLDHRIWGEIKEHGGEGLCKFLTFVIQVGMWTTFFTLFIITVERFRATTRILERTQPSSMKRRIVTQAFCWVSAMTFATHETTNYSIIEEGGMFKCDHYQTFSIALTISIYVFMFLIYVTIFLLSIVTLIKLSNQQIIQSSLPEQQRRARARRMASAMKMVLISLLLYLCCYLIYDITNILEVLDHEFGFNSIDMYRLEFVNVFLPLVNSCLSPGIYLIFLSDFRKAAKRLFCASVSPLETTGSSVQQQPSNNNNMININSNFYSKNNRSPILTRAGFLHHDSAAEAITTATTTITATTTAT